MKFQTDTFPSSVRFGLGLSLVVLSQELHCGMAPIQAYPSGDGASRAEAVLAVHILDVLLLDQERY